jgi:hypothetical protein
MSSPWLPVQVLRLSADSARLHHDGSAIYHFRRRWVGGGGMGFAFGLGHATRTDTNRIRRAYARHPGIRARACRSVGTGVYRYTTDWEALFLNSSQRQLPAAAKGSYQLRSGCHPSGIVWISGRSQWRYPLHFLRSEATRHLFRWQRIWSSVRPPNAGAPHPSCKATGFPGAIHMVSTEENMRNVNIHRRMTMMVETQLKNRAAFRLLFPVAGMGESS